LLNSQEVLLVRFVNLYQSFVGTNLWGPRSADLAAAAEHAGLQHDEYGYFQPGERGAPRPSYDHMTTTDEVIRRGTVYADAWARRVDDGSSRWVRDPFDVINASFGGTTAFMRAWWWCLIQDGDTALTVTQRGLSEWLALKRPDLRRTWTGAEVEADAGRAGIPLDPKHLVEAAADTRLKIVAEPQ
jgi:hypothetical protein